MKIEVDINRKQAKQVIDDVFMSLDLHRYIGYWADLEKRNSEGFLVYKEFEAGVRNKKFTMCPLLAKECLIKLVETIGNDLDNADGYDYDVAVQKAIFRKVKYG